MWQWLPIIWKITHVSSYLQMLLVILLVTHPCKFPSNTHVFLYTQTLSLFLACSLFGIPFLTHTQTLPTLDMTYTLQSHHKSIPKQMQVGMHECLFANGYCFPTPTQPEAGRELAYTLPFIWIGLKKYYDCIFSTNFQCCFMSSIKVPNPSLQLSACCWSDLEQTCCIIPYTSIAGSNFLWYSCNPSPVCIKSSDNLWMFFLILYIIG